MQGMKYKTDQSNNQTCLIKRYELKTWDFKPIEW